MKTTIQNNLFRRNRSFSYALTAILCLALLTNCSKDDAPAPTPEAATISSISPQSGPKATLVTINGNGFGDNTNQTSVYFNEVEATVQSVTDTKITAIVPARAFTGVLKVIVSGTELIGPEFEYLISDIQVSTFAGSSRGYANGPAANAQFNRPDGIAMDSHGNVYIGDTRNHKIRKITPNGQVSVFAGSTEGNTDGTGINAQFSHPSGITIDSQDNLYVVDSGNNNIRKISPSGIVSTFAGSTEGDTDGMGTDAKFNEPIGITMDEQGILYVADSGNNKIRKISPSGIVSTFAGSIQGDADGTGTSAQFSTPIGIIIDSHGTVYVGDTFNNKIRKITPNGQVSTVAGNIQGDADGTGTNAQFNFPIGITIDNQDNLYVADSENNKIRKINPNGIVTTLAGSTQGDADGTGLNAQFNSPSVIVLDNQNNFYIADYFNHKIRKITQE